VIVWKNRKFRQLVRLHRTKLFATPFIRQVETGNYLQPLYSICSQLLTATASSGFSFYVVGDKGDSLHLYNPVLPQWKTRASATIRQVPINYSCSNIAKRFMISSSEAVAWCRSKNQLLFWPWIYVINIQVNQSEKRNIFNFVPNLWRKKSHEFTQRKCLNAGVLFTGNREEAQIILKLFLMDALYSFKTEIQLN